MSTRAARDQPEGSGQRDLGSASHVTTICSFRVRRDARELLLQRGAEGTTPQEYFEAPLDSEIRFLLSLTQVVFPLDLLKAC